MADSSLVPVPRVPTPAMIEAHYRAHAEAPTVFASAEQVWAAMIEAAAPAREKLREKVLAALIDALPPTAEISGPQTERVAEAILTSIETALDAGEDGDACGICNLALVEGDRCLTDVDLGPVHAACSGQERESYVGPDGEPLKEGDPLPTPWIWGADR